MLTTILPPRHPIIVITAALVGLLVGCFLNWAGDFLPANARRHPVAPASTPALASWLWRWLKSPAASPGQPWVWLHVGVELFTAILLACLVWSLGLTIEALFVAAASVFLLLVAIVDLKYRLVLNQLVYPAIVMTLLVRVWLLGQPLFATLLGGLLAFTMFYLVMLLRPGDLGGGDVKLAVLLGVLFGFPRVLWALLIGAIAGGLGAAVILSPRRRAALKHIPYAPFLCLGALAVLILAPVL